MKKIFKLSMFIILLLFGYVLTSISTHAFYTENILIVNYLYRNDEKAAPRYYSDECVRGETYIIDSPTIEGYKPSIETVEYLFVDSNRFDVYYDPIDENQKYNLTINYIDENKNVLENPYQDELDYLEKYNVSSPSIYGFNTKNLVVSGTISHNTTIDVIYKKNDYNLIINYIDEDENIMADTYQKSYKYLDEYSVESPDIYGYTPSVEIASGTIEDNTTIDVIYTKNDYVLQISYLDDDNKIVKDKFQKTYKYLDEYDIDIEDIYGYTKDTDNISGTIEEDLSFNVIYTKNEYTLTINYLDTEGNVLFDSYQKTYKYLDEYNIKSPNKEGYTPDYEYVDGTITKDLEIDVIYAINEYTLTINYKNIDGEIISKQYNDILKYNEEYNIESPTIAGYYTNQKIVSGNIKENLEIDVIYDYIIIHVTIYYVDEFKNNILEPSILNLRFFEDYKIETPRVDGYHTDKDMIEGSVVNTDVTVYINYYRDFHQMTGDQVIIYVATYIKENIGYVSIVFDIFKTIFIPYFSFFRGL